MPGREKEKPGINIEIEYNYGLTTRRRSRCCEVDDGEASRDSGGNPHFPHFSGLTALGPLSHLGRILSSLRYPGTLAFKGPS